MPETNFQQIPFAEAKPGNIISFDGDAAQYRVTKSYVEGGDRPFFHCRMKGLPPHPAPEEEQHYMLPQGLATKLKIKLLKTIDDNKN